MRIIFQNGEIADLNNVDKIIANNEGEVTMLLSAVYDFSEKEVVNVDTENVPN